MKNKEIMKGDVCSPDLCDIILGDVISMLKNGSIKTGNCKGTIKAIKKSWFGKSYVFTGIRR